MKNRGTCIYCGENIKRSEQYYDGIAYLNRHRRCHKVHEKVYSCTWKFFSDLYVEHGYPPAHEFFPPEFEYISSWTARMERIRSYKAPVLPVSGKVVLVV